jgi:hypothetical protein
MPFLAATSWCWRIYESIHLADQLWGLRQQTPSWEYTSQILTLPAVKLTRLIHLFQPQCSGVVSLMIHFAAHSLSLSWTHIPKASAIMKNFVSCSEYYALIFLFWLQCRDADGVLLNFTHHLWSPSSTQSRSVVQYLIIDRACGKVNAFIHIFRPQCHGVNRLKSSLRPICYHPFPEGQNISEFGALQCQHPLSNAHLGLEA